MISKSEIEIIKSRMNKATPGPWEWNEPRMIRANWWHFDLKSRAAKLGLYPMIDKSVIRYEADYGISSDDAQFIANAREDVPRLIAELERLREFFTYTYNLIEGDTAQSGGE